MLMIKVSKQKRERSRAECEKNKQNSISNIYALCNINDQVTWGEKFSGDTGEDC